jgi:hypothetical protein
MSNVLSVGLSFALNTNSSKTLPLAIVNPSDQQSSWSAVTDSPNWMSLDRTSGTLLAHEVQTIYVTAQSGQTTGDFAGKLTFTPTVGGIAQAVVELPVELHVSSGIYSDNGPKAPTVSQSRIDFATQLGIMGPSQLQVTSNPIELNNVNWTMTSKANWLTLNEIINGVTQAGGQKIKGTLLAGQSLKVNVTSQNAPAVKGTYTTDLILTLTFSDPALAGHEPTSILIPISVVV